MYLYIHIHMSNFTILLYNKNDPTTEIPYDTYSEIYKDIILKYHYPACMNEWRMKNNTLVFDPLSTIEKTDIIQDEFALLSRKISKQHNKLKLVRIPRVVYDLGFSHYCHPQNYNLNSHVFLLDKYKKYETLCKHITQVSHKEQYIELLHKINHKIIQYIFSEKRKRIYINWKDVMQYFLTTPTEYIIKEEEYKEGSSETQEDLQLRLHSNIINTSIMHEYDIAEIYDYFRKMKQMQQYKSLFSKVLKVELQSDHKDSVYLFRGVSRKYENAIMASDNKHVECNENSKGFSNSYSMSFLAGYFTDESACAYDYMKTSEYKYVCKVRKHFDMGIEYELFHIPPIHPVLQMFGRGQYWHPRSKIFHDSNLNCIGEFSGDYTFHQITHCMYGPTFPEYLRSSYNCQEMVENYTHFLKNNRSEMRVRHTIQGTVKIKHPSKSRSVTSQTSRKTRSLKHKSHSA